METNNEMWNASAYGNSSPGQEQSVAGCDEEWNIDVTSEQIEEELRTNNLLHRIRGNSAELALTPEEAREAIARRELSVEPSGLFCSKEANKWMEEAQR